MLFQIAAEEHQRLRQQSPVLEQCRDQQATDTPIAIREGMNGFKLRMNERYFDQGGKSVAVS